MSVTQFRAEITVAEQSVRVECFSRLVNERQPGWFGTSDQAWADAVARLTNLSRAAESKASDIQTMLERRRT